MSITVYRSTAQLPEPCWITDCAVSGGTLEGFLRAALEQAQGKLCVRISPVYMRFPLPCPGGVGQSLSAEACRQLRGNRPLHHSSALCTDYFSLLQEGCAHIVLMDSPDTLRRKLRCCDQLGVPYAVCPELAQAE